MSRGFHNLSPEKRKEIASKGGKAVQKLGNARKWTPEQAREAGKKGGLVKQENLKRRKENARQVEKVAPLEHIK